MQGKKNHPAAILNWEAQPVTGKKACPATPALSWVNLLTHGSSWTRCSPAETSHGAPGAGSPGCRKAPGQPKGSMLLGAPAQHFTSIPSTEGQQDGGRVCREAAGHTPALGCRGAPVIPLQPSPAAHGQEGVRARRFPRGCSWVTVFTPQKSRSRRGSPRCPNPTG